MPAIAVDGTPERSSRTTAETLALIRPAGQLPPKLDGASGLRGGAGFVGDPRSITLDGDFSFDALSPDGETLYLIEYTDPRDYDRLPGPLL